MARSDKPARPGLYQCQGADGKLYWSYFDTATGKWGLISASQEGAIGWRTRPSANQYRKWRGMASSTGE